MTDAGPPGAAGPPGPDHAAGRPDPRGAGKPGGPGRQEDPVGSEGRTGPEDLTGLADLGGPQDLAGTEIPGPPGGYTQLPRTPKAWADMLRRAEHAAVHRAEGVRVPAWLRHTRGEPRWPVTLTVIAAIGLQLVLPDRLGLRPRYLLPALEGALLIGLIIANPVRIERRSRIVAVASIAVTFLITIANATSGILLIRAIVYSQPGTDQAISLLGSGAAIWLTNVIAFALWYWEFDRGGPVRRAEGKSPYPDFLFPQMTEPKLSKPDWEPYFADYLYLSFTNATAFSPTDVMPLARWAKLTMAAQSAVSLALVALVLARAVNILK
ncbi:MAG TPA: hypothetical protein VLW50_06915 [Streptosporangiaceae bacterium]|nr:hypothetical protein [Streptosporangiaceae bacterium]